MAKALITGITGQDGTHLTKLLISKGYEVFGIVSGQNSERANRLKETYPEVNLVLGDLTDYFSIHSAISDVLPDEIYNLGAISHVGMSFLQPELTANVTGLGILRILESCRTISRLKDVRIYQASSSEMFGKVRETPQNELTPFHPRSPYGVAKAFAHHTAVNYREAYGIKVSCGILFNHEGENRGTEFVTRKISQGVARIRLGLSDEIALGSLDPKRDWGYAGDYVEAMWRMLQMEKSDDFVIATGETHSVREFLIEAFAAAGIVGDFTKFVRQDSAFFRPAEVDLLVGNPSKAKEVLGWESTTDFRQLVHLMVKNDLMLQAQKEGLPLPETPCTTSIKS